MFSFCSAMFLSRLTKKTWMDTSGLNFHDGVYINIRGHDKLHHILKELITLNEHVKLISLICIFPLLSVTLSIWPISWGLMQCMQKSVSAWKIKWGFDRCLQPHISCSVTYYCYAFFGGWDRKSNWVQLRHVSSSSKLSCIIWLGL